MTVINASPAIHLDAVLPGGIGALPGVIGEVAVPFEVAQELADGRAKDDTWLHIRDKAGIILLETPSPIHPLLEAQLDRGEAAVIQTALDGHKPVILDDLKARRVATLLGLTVTGTLGILIQARRCGLLASVRDAINELDRRGMWISPGTAAKAIFLAGEGGDSP